MGNSNLRLDIQGLRALAVLSVVIFHISPEHLTGGYLGVDIFFVISGFLIIGQLWRALNNNKFSFSEFYYRRFKRLLPALLVVLCISSVAAYFLLLPSEYKNYAYSVFSSLFYFSNFYFYSQSGYFDAEMQSAPLLHTWSLSVEEQFYFIFPILLFLIYKFTPTRIRTLFILSAIALVSFVVSEWLLTHDPSLSFYISPTRFWQFIAGGLLAISGFEAQSKTNKLLCSILGLVILAYTIWVFTEATLFPGINALPVTLATVILLYARPNLGLIGYITSNPLGHFFGNISYSLYLWHWPIIIFYKAYVFRELDRFDKLALFVISILLGYLTYRFVELPFKNWRTPPVTTKAFILPTISTVILTMVVIMLIDFQSLRFSPTQLKADAYQPKGHILQRMGTCFITSRKNNFSYYDKNTCIDAQPNKKNYLLIGDSHSAHWYPAINSSLTVNETLSQANASGCKPLLPLKGENRCTDLMAWVFNTLIEKQQYDKVYIAGRWRIEDAKKINATITHLQQYVSQVVVLGPVIEYEHRLPQLLAKFGDTAPNAIMKYAKFEQQRLVDDSLHFQVTAANGEYKSVLKAMCSSPTLCQHTVDDGIPIQSDYGHLTNQGAQFLLNKIENASQKTEQND
ncbi:acyltransferase family protein [uncultured Paraglaciecola sp.]|uniref:acyltransferase family protein n=1 Tax=uncultured Paraglaciecola sp. TaxID=1765024 RepID=UPI0030DDAF98|tara:strand:- start:68775 stop:70658 length:1884 start_codon:yes stop_codon:yes gene_type:complete